MIYWIEKWSVKKVTVFLFYTRLCTENFTISLQYKMYYSPESFEKGAF
jgi:hypothetical protein